MFARDTVLRRRDDVTSDTRRRQLAVRVTSVSPTWEVGYSPRRFGMLINKRDSMRPFPDVSNEVFDVVIKLNI